MMSWCFNYLDRRSAEGDWTHIVQQTIFRDEDINLQYWSVHVAWDDLSPNYYNASEVNLWVQKNKIKM